VKRYDYQRVATMVGSVRMMVMTVMTPSHLARESRDLLPSEQASEEARFQVLHWHQQRCPQQQRPAQRGIVVVMTVIIIIANIMIIIIIVIMIMIMIIVVVIIVIMNKVMMIMIMIITWAWRGRRTGARPWRPARSSSPPSPAASPGAAGTGPASSRTDHR
jgi:hypothetical protein